MKIKVTLFMLASLLVTSFAFSAIAVEAVEVETGPVSATDGVEGSNPDSNPSSATNGVEGDNPSANPSSATDGVEGENPSTNPPAATDGVEGENPENNDDDNNSSSRSGGSSGQKKSSNRPAPQGEVLGAFTGSCPFLTTYMRIGQANDVAEVKMLQEFLNSELSISLPVTGFFGQLTHDAVNAFQLKYKNDVLAPWVEAGLHASENEPTGYVYLTTRYMINKIVCPDLDAAEPVLPKTL